MVRLDMRMEECRLRMFWYDLRDLVVVWKQRQSRIARVSFNSPGCLLEYTFSRSTCRAFMMSSARLTSRRLQVITSYFNFYLRKYGRVIPRPSRQNLSMQMCHLERKKNLKRRTKYSTAPGRNDSTNA